MRVVPFGQVAAVLAAVRPALSKQFQSGLRMKAPVRPPSMQF